MLLSRFKANPKLIRVGVQRRKGRWYVRIAERDNPVHGVGASNICIETAMELAMQRAEEAELRGLDSFMQWTYEHPQKGTEK